MIRIKTPATTTNLSVAFDSAGIALDIYNSFLFEKSKEFRLSGFPKQFNLENNLVLDAYKAFSLKFLDETDIIPVEISLEENNIPYSRGLGSSATCILAGVLAANQIHQLNQSFQACVEFASDYEGHPDNVFACAYGGLTMIFKNDKDFFYKTYQPNISLFFHLLIPNSVGQTKALRDILPSKVLFEDAVFHLSRTAFLPNAFVEGDFSLLKNVLQDKLHEKYRYEYLPLNKDIQALKTKDDLITCISGSGPSVLLISKDKDVNLTEKIKDTYQHRSVNACQGLTIEVIE